MHSFKDKVVFITGGSAAGGGITALGRMGRPADVVNMALFLASDQANFITGGEFTVDGGLTAGLSNTIVNSLWGN